MALTSCNKRLRGLAASLAPLWASLELAAPARRLWRLARWLRARGTALRRLAVTIRCAGGDDAPTTALTALLRELHGATRLARLRVAFEGWVDSTYFLLVGGLYLPAQLRALELHSEPRLFITGSLAEHSALTRLALTGNWTGIPSRLFQPLSLRQLEMPEAISELPIAGWSLGLAEMSGLRDLRLACSWAGGPDGGSAHDTLDLGGLATLELTPQLETLTVDCSRLTAQQPGLSLVLRGEGLQRLSRLRSLALIAAAGPSNLAFLRSLTALQLTALRLARASAATAAAGGEELDELPQLQAGLSSLEALSLEGFSLAGLAPLALLPALRRLCLAGCELGHVAPAELRGWPALEASGVLQVCCSSVQQPVLLMLTCFPSSHAHAAGMGGSINNACKLVHCPLPAAGAGPLPCLPFRRSPRCSAARLRRPHPPGSGRAPGRRCGARHARCALSWHPQVGLPPLVTMCMFLGRNFRGAHAAAAVAQQ